MSGLAPNLFQRRFQDFMQIGRARLPSLSPEWTDHNAHDPGITLMGALGLGFRGAAVFAVPNASRRTRCVRVPVRHCAHGHTGCARPDLAGFPGFEGTRTQLRKSRHHPGRRRGCASRTQRRDIPPHTSAVVAAGKRRQRGVAAGERSAARSHVQQRTRRPGIFYRLASARARATCSPSRSALVRPWFPTWAGH